MDINGKSKVINLCPWSVSWKRDTLTGDELLKANGTFYILNQEIESQVRNGNVYYNGTDGKGSHARVYIENPELREELEFDNKEEKRTQDILNDEKCEKLLSYKTLSAFEKNLVASVVCNHEMAKIMKYARSIKLNDYDKIKVLESHCNMTI